MKTTLTLFHTRNQAFSQAIRAGARISLPPPLYPVTEGILPAVEGGILPPGPALEWRRTAIPPGKMPGSTAGRMPAATGWRYPDAPRAGSALADDLGGRYVGSKGRRLHPGLWQLQLETKL